jgi:hypothetical protein
MGEVYQASRYVAQEHVAIKILPDVFVGDPERVARFQREAESTRVIEPSPISSPTTG